MVDELLRLRHKYGARATFVTILPDGLEVPWHALTIGEYLQNVRKLEPPEDIEDKVFATGVTSEYLVNNIHEIKAGTIGTIAGNIISASAPSSPEELNLIFNYFRQAINANVLNQLIILICRAFPGYTPKILSEMMLEEFMYNAALAEAKLLESGIITEPLQLITSAPEPQQPAPPKSDSRQIRDNWVAQHQTAPPPVQAGINRNAPPIPSGARKTVITSRDVVEHKMALTGDEQANFDILQAKMLEETLPIYKDYLEMMKKGVKITPDTIKTVEQRQQEAVERMKENEKKNKIASVGQTKAEKQKTARLERLYEKHLPKRKHRK
jgi:hypothetical protein